MYLDDQFIKILRAFFSEEKFWNEGEIRLLLWFWEMSTIHYFHIILHFALAPKSFEHDEINEILVRE